MKLFEKGAEFNPNGRNAKSSLPTKQDPTQGPQFTMDLSALRGSKVLAQKESSDSTYRDMLENSCETESKPLSPVPVSPEPGITPPKAASGPNAPAPKSSTPVKKRIAAPSERDNKGTPITRSAVIHQTPLKQKIASAMEQDALAFDEIIHRETTNELIRRLKDTTALLNAMKVSQVRLVIGEKFKKRDQHNQPSAMIKFPLSFHHQEQVIKHQHQQLIDTIQQRVAVDNAMLNEELRILLHNAYLTIQQLPKFFHWLIGVDSLQQPKAALAGQNKLYSAMELLTQGKSREHLHALNYACELGNCYAALLISYYQITEQYDYQQDLEMIDHYLKKAFSHDVTIEAPFFQLIINAMPKQHESIIAQALSIASFVHVK